MTLSSLIFTFIYKILLLEEGFTLFDVEVIPANIHFSYCDSFYNLIDCLFYSIVLIDL